MGGAKQHHRLEKAWDRHYARIAKTQGKPHQSNVFVGFNANIDAVIYLDKSFEKMLCDNGIKDVASIPEKEPDTINTKEDLLKILLKGVAETREMEIPTKNMALVDWVENEFKIHERRIGGQAGIMSNFLDSIGLRVVFSTPRLSSKMAELLPKTLIVPDERGLKNISDAEKTKFTKTNYIFEYSKGLSLFGKKAGRPDRIILATRPSGVEPMFHQKTTGGTLSFFELIDRAILSGFHSLGIEDIDLFEKIHSQIEEIKKINPELKIHVEEAYVAENRVADKILEIIVRHVHSIGLNEVELAKFLLVFEKKNKSVAIEKSNYSLLECYLGARDLFGKLKLERLHLHSQDYCMVLVSKTYGTGPEKVRDGLVFAMLCAAAKAQNGRIRSIAEIYKTQAAVNTEGIMQIIRMQKELGLCEGFLESGICDMGNHFVVCAPARTAKKIKSTVGLGDVVSSSAFVYDVL